MKVLITTLLAAASFSALAGDLVIERTPLGSGTPGLEGREATYLMPDGMLFAPQYLPGFPTAAVIWPRVVEVQCELKDKVTVCDGYQWTPKLGRGEYIFIVPVNKPVPPAPIIVTNTIERVVTVPLPVQPAATETLPPAPNKKIGG
jgi:hypothetical protein